MRSTSFAQADLETRRLPGSRAQAEQGQSLWAMLH
jgi:hypothetical protein